MSGLFDGLSPGSRARLGRHSQPRWTRPMLATLTHEPFSDPGWIYERKLDGVRCLVFRTPRQVRLVSRNRKSMNRSYPELVEALEETRAPFVADGEIVAFEGNVTSFSRLQGRIGIEDPERARASGIAVYLYLFDLLHAEGCDLTHLPLSDRKALLRKALVFDDPLRFTPHRREHGEAYLEEACAKGWEGVVAKDASAPYEHRRSRKWLKFKCGNRQELVVGGYTEPRGSRVGFGALLVGYYDSGSLRYAGKVGTGYSNVLLERLCRSLASRERATSPFAGEVPERGVHWVRPELVVEVGFTEWTRGGRLRHPRFLGVRPDKDAKEVGRERSRPAPRARGSGQEAGRSVSARPTRRAERGSGR